jgi:hypothetical protein
MAHSAPNEQLYYRLFDNLPPLVSNVADLELLSTIMEKADPPLPVPEPEIIIPDPKTIGSTMPALITYWGQFVDHDITFEDKSILGPNPTNINELINERTSWFDLDCVYGANNQYLTEENGTKFLIVLNAAGEEDLPRDPLTGQALIADIRNNENLIIQHIQLAFFRFHNRVITELSVNTQLTLVELVAKAKKIVSNHYQHMLINEYIKIILLPEEFNRLFVNDFDIFTSRIYGETPKMPIEVAGALYRFGHALVRNEYYLNANEELPIFSLKKPLDMRGMRPLPPGLHLDWHLFTPTQNFNGFQVTEKIDPFLVQNLFQLPLDNNDSLARRNLVRGNVYQLPSGQSVAKYLGVPYLDNANLDPNFHVNISLEANFAAENALDPETVITPEVLTFLNNTFGSETPLWYYTLKEGEVFGNGNRLGPMASRVVGEFFYSLLKKSTTSILNNPFTPTVGNYGCVENGVYLFCDWVAYSFNLPVRDPLLPLPTAENNNLHLDVV